MTTIVGPVNASQGAPGGLYAALNVTAASVIKASAGVLVRISVDAAGTAGNLVINDCATTGTATTANQIASVAFGSLSGSTPIYLEWPCATGIVISAVPTGSQFSVSFT